MCTLVCLRQSPSKLLYAHLWSKIYYQWFGFNPEWNWCTKISFSTSFFQFFCWQIKWNYLLDACTETNARIWDKTKQSHGQNVNYVPQKEEEEAQPRKRLPSASAYRLITGGGFPPFPQTKFIKLIRAKVKTFFSIQPWRLINKKLIFYRHKF